MKISEEVQYIWHDGATIPENLLISMAKTAGTYDGAKPYLFSLLAHGVMHGIGEYINKVNEIREQYNVQPIPVPNDMEENGFRQKHSYSNSDKAKKKYLGLSEQKKHEVLMSSLYVLMSEHQGLFTSKTHWIGIFLVIHDRLDGKIIKTNFKVLASAITPAQWPAELCIGDSTMGNFSRLYDYSDRLEAYYDMENNPQKDLCNTFWDILESQIMLLSDE